jgi:ABC-type phosphate transport system substrate-binding protein
MRLFTRLQVLCALVLAVAGAPARAQTPYVLVVNARNPVATLSAPEVSNMFLRKASRWDGGGEIQPVDLSEGSAVRERFSQAVHGKAVAAVRAYWQRQIFSGRGVPPVEKSTDGEVLAYVQANVNAIGYVAAGTPLGAGVKSVAVTK